MSDSQIALSTTKRKFHQLLDNLTANRSTTSLASTVGADDASIISVHVPSRTEPPSKRSRVSNATMDNQRVVSDKVKDIQQRLLRRKEADDRQHPSTVRIIGGKLVKSFDKPLEPRKSRSYAPYSQEQFLARLKTFADVKLWTMKPDKISEVEWAKRGWVCDSWNKVACHGGCGKRLLIKLMPKRKDENGKEIEFSEDFEVGIRDGLVEKYQELIVTGHEEGCLWRRMGCKDDIYHIPIANRAQSAEDFRHRYQSCLAIETDLPPVESLKLPDPSPADVLKSVDSSFLDPADSTDTHSPPSLLPFTFALFGWSGAQEGNVRFAVCNHCFQRLALWIYTTSRLEEMSKKLDVPFDHLRLDILGTHREHCPWINAKSQANPRDGRLANKAGWQTLEYIIMRRKREETPAEEEAFEARHGGEQDRTDKLTETWRKLKSKLRKSTSTKSLNSAKSVKAVATNKAKDNQPEKEKSQNRWSLSSVRSNKTVPSNAEKAKENGQDKAAENQKTV